MGNLSKTVYLNNTAVNYAYGITKESYSLGDSLHVAYGIAAYANSEEDGTSTIVASIHDITTNEQAILELMQQCNRLGLSTIHLFDVMEDFFAI